VNNNDVDSDRYWDLFAQNYNHRDYNNWEQVGTVTGSCLNRLCPCPPALMRAPVSRTSSALRWSALRAFTQPLSEVLLSRSAFFCFLRDLCVLETCFSPTQEETHVTADTIVYFVSLEISSLVTAKHVTIFIIPRQKIKQINATKNAYILTLTATSVKLWNKRVKPQSEIFRKSETHVWKLWNMGTACDVRWVPCNNMARPRVADGGMASSYEG
jgi:hypothetical protein